MRDMDNIGYLLSDRARLLRRAFNAQVREMGLTGPQARLLLSLLRTEGENQGFYAERLDVEPITLCRMVDRMEEAGFVERRRDPADRRAWRIHATPRAREMSARVLDCVDGLIEEMLAGVSSAERETFANVLTLIGANLGAAREDKVAAHG